MLVIRPPMERMLAGAMTNPPDEPAEDEASDSLPSTVLDRLAEIFDGDDDAVELSDDKDKTKARIARILLSESYKGAFPHPDNLRQFNEVVENGAERAFALTEREQEHRHECDNKIIDAQIRATDSEGNDRRLVIILAFSFAFVSLIATVVLVVMGKNIGGGLLGVVSLLSAIAGGVFYGRSRGVKPPSRGD